MNHIIGLPLLLAAVTPCSAKEGPRDAPAAVSFAKTEQGRVFANKDHRTLYALSFKTAQQRSGPAIMMSDYCTGPCAESWSPFVPAKDAAPIGRWTIVTGASGPQWAYDRNPVFTFNEDKKAGDRKGHLYMKMWFAISYVPPKPVMTLPAAVNIRLLDEAYELTDASGQALVMADGKNDCDCKPFAAAMAGLPIGDWTILKTGDVPQWALRGKPVFVRIGETGGKVLRP